MSNSESRIDSPVFVSPQQRIERLAEAVAGEDDAGFGFRERGAEVFGRGLGAAEEGGGIDFRAGDFVAFSRPRFIRAETDEDGLRAPHGDL